MIHQLYKKGEITIFLSLLLSVILGLLCVLTESVRVQAIRLNLEEIMDASLNSCFGEYDSDLYRRYDLLFVDAAYRSDKAGTIDDMIAHLAGYIRENSENTDKSISDFYEEELTDIKALKYVYASDGGGKVLKKQAVDYIRKYGSINNTTNIQTNKSEAASINPIDFFGEWDRLLMQIDRYNLVFVNPAKIVRGMVLGEDEYIAGGDLKMLESGDVASVRRLKSGKAPSGFIKSSDEMLFLEYLMQKCGYYVRHSGEQELSCELEYIIGGLRSDRDNMKYVINKLLEIKLSNNLSAIKSDRSKVEEAEKMAKLEVGIYKNPTLTRLLRDAIIYALAYAETAIDVSGLLSGGASKICKSSGDIRLQTEDLLKFRSYLFNASGTGIVYKDYLGIFLMEIPDNMRIKRFMDIVERNMRKFSNKGFRIDSCICYLRAEAEFSSRYNYNHIISREMYVE